MSTKNMSSATICSLIMNLHRVAFELEPCSPPIPEHIKLPRISVKLASEMALDGLLAALTSRGSKRLRHLASIKAALRIIMVYMNLQGLGVESFRVVTLSSFPWRAMSGDDGDYYWDSDVQLPKPVLHDADEWYCEECGELIDSASAGCQNQGCLLASEPHQED